MSISFNIIIFSLQEDWRFGFFCYTTPGGGRHPTQIRHWSLAASPRHVLPAQQSERWGSSGSSHSWMVCYLPSASLLSAQVKSHMRANVEICGDDKLQRLQSYDFVVSCVFQNAIHWSLTLPTRWTYLPSKRINTMKTNSNKEGFEDILICIVDSQILQCFSASGVNGDSSHAQVLFQGQRFVPLRICTQPGP